MTARYLGATLLHPFLNLSIWEQPSPEMANIPDIDRYAELDLTDERLSRDRLVYLLEQHPLHWYRVYQIGTTQEFKLRFVIGKDVDPVKMEADLVNLLNEHHLYLHPECMVHVRPGGPKADWQHDH